MLLSLASTRSVGIIWNGNYKNCYCYFQRMVQAGISAACQFQLHSALELFTAFLLEPAVPAAHVYNQDGQIKRIRGKQSSPRWHKRQLILIVRIIISLICRRALVIEIVGVKLSR